MIQEAFIEPQWIEIDVGRWDVRLKIKDRQGQEREFVASADSSFTDNSGIWFSTMDEFRERLTFGD